MPENTPASRAWPEVSYETRQWHIDPGTYVSSSQRRRHSGPYQAAVVPKIAGLEPRVSTPVAAAAEEAAAEIARFDEYAGNVFADGEIAPLRSVLLRSESSASSQIENLTVGSRQLALAEAGQQASRNATIVAANVRTMDAAVRLAEDMSPSTILAMHRTLLEDSQAEHAGQFRTAQVWIGGSQYGPHTAAFVPPHHRHVQADIDDLVSFARRDDLPAFGQIAITHAQFETIHPFADGNGRTGRALIHAMLRRRGLVARSTVPVSAGLLVDTSSYFDALTAYRDGDLSPIVSRLAEASFLAITNGRTLIDDLAEIQKSWSERINVRKQAAAWRLRDLVLAQPVVTGTLAAERLGTSWDTAQAAIDHLTAVGILRPLSVGKRDRAWVADDVLSALDGFADRAGRRITM